MLMNFSSVAFDTGSSDILIPSTACTTSQGCEPKGAKFNSARSSTFSATSRPWQTRFGTGVGVGVGSAATPFCAGNQALDTVTVAGLAVKGQTIGLINRQSPNLFEGTGIEGIFGMGFSGGSTLRTGPYFQNLINQKKIDQPIFSMYMTPKAVGDAELTLGGTDPSKYSGDINYVPVNSSSGSWTIRFASITVNGKSTSIKGQTAIADSGTSNMIAPARDAAAIYSLISRNITLLDPKGAYGIPCSMIKDLNATITFSIGGKPYTIPSQELSVGPFPGRQGICQTVINSGPMGRWIIGASLMKYYYTVWDVGNSRMGWATTNHSPNVQ
jgi:hypothetical protein